jgi:hypothetical protein
VPEEEEQEGEEGPGQAQQGPGQAHIHSQHKTSPYFSLINCMNWPGKIPIISFTVTSVTQLNSSPFLFYQPQNHLKSEDPIEYIPSSLNKQITPHPLKTYEVK